MFLLLISTLIFVFLFHQFFWRRRNLSPGPVPLPYFGNMLSTKRPCPGYECFLEWKKKYGDVFTFWMGSEPYVVIASYEKMKETFILDGDTYVDKKPLKLQIQFRGGTYGVIETSGKIWRDHRRFALHQLRDLGLGKDVMQQKILIEVEEMFKELDKALGVEQNMTKVMEQGVANVMNQILFGYRFDETNMEEFREMQSVMRFQGKELGSVKVFVEVFLPALAKLLPGPGSEEIFAKSRTQLYNFFSSRIERHRAEIDFDIEESEDYAEGYLKEQKRRENARDFDSFSNIQLTNMCLDLWSAGLSTTVITLTWSIAYLLHNPRIQEKIHEELDRVVGSDRLITTSDKTDLVYMNAFINESQRCANIVPINLYHSTTRDTEISGYHIPKGTGTIAQIATVMLDENVFPDPFTFNPERFIENGKLKKIEEFVPFSVGKRQCLGEGLAKMELFLFVSNFLNRYKIEPSQSGLPCIDKTKSYGVPPRQLDVILTKRH